MSILRNLLIVALFALISFLTTYSIVYNNDKDNLSTNLMESEYSRIRELAEGTNKMVHLPLATANYNPGNKMSPDVLYSAMSYDLSETPVGVYLPLPSSSWTLSVYDENCRNIYSLDNRVYSSDNLQVVIMPSDNPIDLDKNVKAVKSSSKTGIVIVRYIMPSPDSKNHLVEIRREMQTGLINTKNI